MRDNKANVKKGQPQENELQICKSDIIYKYSKSDAKTLGGAVSSLKILISVSSQLLL